jgi:hypothetical protein
MEEEKDPFSEFGGTEVKPKRPVSKDPFSEFGGSEIPKKAGGAGSPLISSLSPSGSELIPNSQQRTDLTPVLPQHRDEIRQQQGIAQNRLQQQLNENLSSANPDLQAQVAHIEPQEKQTIQSSKEPSVIDRTKFGLKYLTGNLAKGIASSTVAPLYYYANKAGLASDSETKKVLDNISTSDKETFGIKPENLNNAGGVLGAGGGLAKMLPALITAEGTGGASFALQNVGDAALQVQQMKDSGVEFKNHADDLYINGMGLVGLALGRGAFGKVFSKMPSSLRNSVTRGIVSETMQSLGKKGADLTAEDVMQSLMTKAAEVPQRVLGHGIDALQTYAKVGTEMSAANIASFGLKNASNILNGTEEKPFKDVTGSDFVHGASEPFYSENFNDKGNPLKALANIATSTAGQFGILHGVMNGGVLFKNSPYENPIIDRIRENSSPESVQSIKDDLTHIGKEKGLSDEEIYHSHDGVDELANTIGKLPKQLPKNKLREGVSLIMGKNELDGELKQIQDERAKLHPSINDIPDKSETLISDKINQANDKLRSLITGDKITYSKGVGEEEGVFYKMLGGKKEEISPSRYALENLERTDNSQIKQTENESIENDTEEKGGITKETNGKANDEKGIPNEKESLLSKTGGDEPPVIKQDEDSINTNSNHTTASKTETESQSRGRKAKEQFLKNGDNSPYIVSTDADGIVKLGIDEKTVRAQHGLRGGESTQSHEGTEVELNTEEKRKLNEIEADKEFGDVVGEEYSKRKRDLFKKVFKRSLDEQGTGNTETANHVSEQPNEQKPADDTGKKIAETPVGKEANRVIPSHEAPTLKEVSSTLEKDGKPGISIEQGKTNGGTEAIPREQTPIEGYKHIVSRGEDGKVNGVIEVSYFNKDGIQDKPQGLKIVVDKDSQRKGIATAMLKHAEDNGIDLSEVRGKAMTDDGKALYDAKLTELSPTDKVRHAIDNETEPDTGGSDKETASGKGDERKAGDPLREFARLARNGKINKLGGFKMSTGFDGVWDGSLEVVARTLEGGAKLADAIEAGLKDIKESDWYKKLSNQKEFDESYRAHLKNEYGEIEKTIPHKSDGEIPEESALNKAAVAENREAIGKEGIMQPESLDADKEYTKAAKKVDEGLLDPIAIAQKVIDKRESPTIEEFNAMLYHNRRIDNQYTEAQAEFDKADEANDYEGKLSASNALITLERAKDILHEAARNVSYNWGYMGRMLQQSVKKDYTLSDLRTLFRAKSDGPIPEDIDKLLTQYSKERDEALKALHDYQGKEAERAAQREIDKAAKSTKNRVKKNQLDKTIEDAFANISKKLKESRSKLSMNPIPPNLIPEINTLVSAYTQKGVIKASEIADAIYERLKGDIEGLTKRNVIDAIAGNGYDKPKHIDDIVREKNDIKTQAKLIARLEDIESGKVKASILKPKSALSKEVIKLRERIKKAAIDNGIPLKNYKENLQKKLDELEAKIKSGDYSREKKERPYTPDQEALRLRSKVRRTEKLIDELGYNLDQRRENTVNKFLDGYIKLHRFFILSRIGTLAKLRAAAMGRQLISPIEEMLGAINKELPGFRKIAERSPRFSKGFKISAEVKASMQHYTKETIADNNQVLKEGHGELDYLFDPRAQKESEMAGFPGRLHAWLKNSTKRAEWQRSFEHIMQWEKENNPELDINDPAVQERVGKEAYNEAKRSIFMNDNMSVDLYNNVLNFAESKWGVTGKTVATAFRALMPIVKIPTNFALEAIDYSTLGARAIPTVLVSVFKGAESLSPKEADFVMRMMRKGQLGGAMMAIAYFNPSHFGGYYVKGQKRKDGDLKAGDMVICGFKVPHLLQHIPLISSMQAAATLRRTQEDYIGKGKNGGMRNGILNAFMGLIENVPFLSAPSELEDALKSDNGFNSYIGQMIKNQVSPGFLQEAAEQTDTKDGSFATINPENTVKRKPDTKDGLGTAIKENVMSGIPGLREFVSEKKDNPTPSLAQIKLNDGRELKLDDKQVNEREKINQDYLAKHGELLKKRYTAGASHDVNLKVKLSKLINFWDKDNVPKEKQKEYTKAIIADHVDKKIKAEANKYSKVMMLRKHRTGQGKYSIKEVEE